MRSPVTDRILQKVGDRATGYILGVFRYFSEELKLSVNTITKNISEELSISARPKGASKWSKLTKDDLELIDLTGLKSSLFHLQK